MCIKIGAGTGKFNGDTLSHYHMIFHWNNFTQLTSGHLLINQPKTKYKLKITCA